MNKFDKDQNEIFIAFSAEELKKHFDTNFLLLIYDSSSFAEDKEISKSFDGSEKANLYLTREELLRFLEPLNEDEQEELKTDPKLLVAKKESLLKVIGLITTSGDTVQQLDGKQSLRLAEALVDEFGGFNEVLDFKLDCGKYGLLNIVKKNHSSAIYKAAIIHWLEKVRNDFLDF